MKSKSMFQRCIFFIKITNFVRPNLQLRIHRQCRITCIPTTFECPLLLLMMSSHVIFLFFLFQNHNCTLLNDLFLPYFCHTYCTGDRSYENTPSDLLWVAFWSTVAATGSPQVVKRVTATEGGWKRCKKPVIRRCFTLVFPRYLFAQTYVGLYHWAEALVVLSLKLGIEKA